MPQRQTLPGIHLVNDEARNRWRAYYTERRSEGGTGQRRQFVATDKKVAIAKAEQARTLWLSRGASPKVRTTSATTVQDWLVTWRGRDSGRPGNWRESTSLRAHSLLNGVLAVGSPRFLALPIGQARPSDIEEVIMALQKSGPNRKAWSARTARHAHSVLRGAFADALREGIISTNPAVGAALPKLTEKEKTRVEVLTDDEMRDLARVLMEWATHHAIGAAELAPPYARYASLSLTCLMLGLRQGEARGLRWESVSLLDAKKSGKTPSIKITSTITAGRRLVEKEPTSPRTKSGPPKSSAGTRTLPLPANLAHLLLLQREAQPEGTLHVWPAGHRPKSKMINRASQKRWVAKYGDLLDADGKLSEVEAVRRARENHEWDFPVEVGPVRLCLKAAVKEAKLNRWLHVDEREKSAETDTWPDAPECEKPKCAGISRHWHLTVHGLRHSAISAMLRHGGSLFAVAKWAGHRSVRLVLDTYGAATDEEVSTFGDDMERITHGDYQEPPPAPVPPGSRNPQGGKDGDINQLEREFWDEML